jgi:uncharacterized oxidoreductase
MAECFINEGNTVIICGRLLDALEEAVSKLPSLIIKQCELKLESERESLYHRIEKKRSDLNFLVNNIGIQNWM